ncbi:UNVERIFIED_CONTAM: hypothetical protein PYX00_007788 [Menopon gallinae]|uniref:Uncharacterized protein n=1 Tax=Menopon gallinae TaxID=328185 RepID=A0AAW2HKL9_9NEOP
MATAFHLTNTLYNYCSEFISDIVYFIALKRKKRPRRATQGPAPIASTSAGSPEQFTYCIEFVPYLSEKPAIFIPPKKPPERTFWEFICNKKEGTCFNRTPLNWTMITIYYIFFLMVVFVTMYACLRIVERVRRIRNPDEPTYGLASSPIGTNPQLNFIPLSTRKGPVLRVDLPQSIREIETFLSQYTDCSQPPCENVTEWLQECGISPFGYDKYTPCIYVKINRVLNWIPDPIVRVDDLPQEVRKELGPHIMITTQPQIWVMCRGENPLTRDHISREKIRHLKHGLSADYYPFQKRQRTLPDPFIAIQINATGAARTLQTFSCRAYAKNLDSEETEAEFLLYVHHV